MKNYWDEEGDVFYKTGHRKTIKLTVERPKGHKGELTMGVGCGDCRENSKLRFKPNGLE